MIAVGKILKPHGTRGDLKAECFMDSPDCFKKIKRVYIDNSSLPFDVKKIIPLKDCLLLTLVGINDMDSAEKYRGMILYCNEEDMPEPDQGRYYVSDIIGCSVVADGKTFGKVIDILQYGSADVIVLSDKGKQHMFPWVKALQAKINLDAKLFEVDAQKLNEVLLNED